MQEKEEQKTEEKTLKGRTGPLNQKVGKRKENWQKEKNAEILR